MKKYLFLPFYLVFFISIASATVINTSSDGYTNSNSDIHSTNNSLALWGSSIDMYAFMDFTIGDDIASSATLQMYQSHNDSPNTWLDFYIFDSTDFSWVG